MSKYLPILSLLAISACDFFEELPDNPPNPDVCCFRSPTYVDNPHVFCGDAVSATFGDNPYQTFWHEYEPEQGKYVQTLNIWRIYVQFGDGEQFNFDLGECGW